MASVMADRSSAALAAAPAPGPCARVRVRGVAEVQAGALAAQLPSGQAAQAAGQGALRGCWAQEGHRAAEARQVRVVGQAWQ